MMKSLKLSLTLTLLAALSMGSMHAMESTTPQKKQQLLQRLVMLFKVNSDLMQQNIHLNLPKEKIKQLRADRRRILKRVAIAGLTTAFLAAIGITAAVAAKKYDGRKKAPAGPPPTFGGGFTNRWYRLINGKKVSFRNLLNHLKKKKSSI